MATIKRFEEIVAWQEARKLACMIYSLTSTGGFAKDFGLRDQIRRAAVSVGSNIAEGFERNGNKEFEKFLWIAKGSTGEVVSQLYTAVDVGYVTVGEVADVMEQARHCAYLIYRFIQSLKASDITGERYKPRKRFERFEKFEKFERLEKSPQTPQTSQTLQTPQTSQTLQTPQTSQT